MDSLEVRIVDLMSEIHNLTRLPRTGWIMAGVNNAESVSDHCYEAAVISFILAEHLDIEVDHGRVIEMLLFHELGESRLTDLPRRGGKYIKAAKSDAERAIANDLLWGVSDRITGLLEEFHARETPEAQLAEASEELQIIFAALMYAKDRNGDMTEYVNDAAAYEDFGIGLAGAVADVIESKLGEYVGNRPYWSLGYSKRPTAT